MCFRLGGFLGICDRTLRSNAALANKGCKSHDVILHCTQTSGKCSQRSTKLVEEKEGEKHVVDGGRRKKKRRKSDDLCACKYPIADQTALNYQGAISNRVCMFLRSLPLKKDPQ